MNIQDAINQCEMSEYECIGGFLRNNLGYIRLKEIGRDSVELLKRLRIQAEFNSEIKLSELPAEFWSKLDGITH